MKEPSNDDQMKTPMQEMFDELYAHSFDIPIGLLAKCAELMAKEKDQMKQAFMEGALSWATGSGFDYYYNETYGEQ